MKRITTLFALFIVGLIVCACGSSEDAAKPGSDVALPEFSLDSQLDLPEPSATSTGPTASRVFEDIPGFPSLNVRTDLVREKVGHLFELSYGTYEDEIKPSSPDPEASWHTPYFTTDDRPIVGGFHPGDLPVVRQRKDRVTRYVVDEGRFVEQVNAAFGERVLGGDVQIHVFISAEKKAGFGLAATRSTYLIADMPGRKAVVVARVATPVFIAPAQREKDWEPIAPPPASAAFFRQKYSTLTLFYGIGHDSVAFACPHEEVEQWLREQGFTADVEISDEPNLAKHLEQLSPGKWSLNPSHIMRRIAKDLKLDEQQMHYDAIYVLPAVDVTASKSSYKRVLFAFVDRKHDAVYLYVRSIDAD